MTPPTTDTSREAVRPYDEQYDTLKCVEQDPTGAMMAIHDLVAERDGLRRDAKEWSENFRSLEKAVVGDTGLSAITVAAQARKYRPMYEATKVERDALRDQLAAAKDLPWRAKDIKRGLILFRTSSNAHGSINYQARSEKVDNLPQSAKDELAAIMVNMALGYSPEEVAANGVVKEWVAAARNEALEEAAALFDEEAAHDWGGVEYSSLVGVPISNADDLRKSVERAERNAERIRALKSTTPAPRHSDDAAVDRFAEAMKAKLATKRADGRGGWDNKKVCSQALLSDLLRGHVDKGDPVDVANFSMMLHQRGEAIMSATREDCPECKGSGMRDSGGVQPWGEPIDVPCDCENAPREVTVQEAALYVCPDDDSALNYLESAYGNDLRCAVSCMLDALRALANEEQSDG